MAKTLADRLDLAPEQELELLRLIDLDRSRKKLRPAARSADAEYSELREDIFSAIADWYHFAILELTRIKEFRWDYKWIGSRLGITSSEARQATERMIRLGLLRVDNKRLTLTNKSLSTTNDIPSSALRLSHRQSLEMAIAALHEVPVDLRDVTSITVATNLQNLPRAKGMIKKFRRQLSKILESGETTEVYNINIQLLPVTKGGDR